METSGLNPITDSLIAVGALGVSDGAIDLADAFEVVLRQDAPSSGANIEVHGIGAAEQLGGEDPAAALERFLEFVGGDPLVAFHAGFDAAVLERAVAARLGRRFPRRWLDIAVVAPLAWPGRAGGSLDSWLEALGIPIAYRHRAIVDCLATAQLFLAVLQKCDGLGVATARSLIALSEGQRWLK